MIINSVLVLFRLDLFASSQIFRLAISEFISFSRSGMLVLNVSNFCIIRIHIRKKTYSEEQHLVNSRYELLTTRQQFCGDISTLF